MTLAPGRCLAPLKEIARKILGIVLRAGPETRIETDCPLLSFWLDAPFFVETSSQTQVVRQVTHCVATQSDFHVDWTYSRSWAAFCFSCKYILPTSCFDLMPPFLVERGSQTHFVRLCPFGLLTSGVPCCLNASLKLHCVCVWHRWPTAVLKDSIPASLLCEKIANVVVLRCFELMPPLFVETSSETHAARQLAASPFGCSTAGVPCCLEALSKLSCAHFCCETAS